MKKNILSILCAVSLFASGIQSAFADKVAVVEDLVFIADGSIIVKNISDGLTNQCLADPVLDILGNPVTNATDIVIEGSNAIVTTSTLDANNVPIIDAVIVDVSSCLTSQVTVPVTECISTVDLDAGLLIIPCVEINGSVVTVHMEQRGESSNWEVKFLGDNVNFDDESHEDDDGHGQGKKHN